MRFRHFGVALALLVVAPSLFADGTIQYRSSIKFGPVIAAVAKASKTPTEIKAPEATSSTMRLKNGKIEEEGSAFAGIYDSKSMQITMIDPKRKIFATSDLKDIIDQLIAAIPARQAVPPQAQLVLQSMTSTFASQKTGRTSMILGIETEETEMTLSLIMTLPAGLLPPMPNSPIQAGVPITLIKIVMDMWSPTPAELQRFPVLGEFSSFWPDQGSMNPAFAGLTAEIEKSLAKYPGLVAALPAMMDYSLKNKTVKLKTEIAIYAPVLAQIAPMMKAQGMPDFDASAAVVTVSSEAVEVSAEPIADSVFVAPGDYKSVPIADFLQIARPQARGQVRVGGSTSPRSGTLNQPADAQGIERLPFR